MGVVGLENSLEEKGNLINKFTCFPTANRRGTHVVERNGELKQTGKTSLVETLKLQQVVWQYTVWIRGAISKSRSLHSFTVDVARLRLGVGVTIELQHYPVGFFLRFRTGVYLALVI